MVVVIGLSSCSAPISYRQQDVPIPTAAIGSAQHSEALEELKAARDRRNPGREATRFFDAARMVSDSAMVGDQAAIAIYNHSVARLAETLEAEGMLPRGTTIEIGEGETRRTLHARRPSGTRNADRQIVVVDALNFRGRPVSMAALTTVLGLIPLLFDAFFVSMAVTVMAGLLFATVLTLIVVPVLYVIFYRYRPDTLPVAS